jgi:hypothetical protein
LQTTEELEDVVVEHGLLPDDQFNTIEVEGVIVSAAAVILAGVSAGV